MFVADSDRARDGPAEPAGQCISDRMLFAVSVAAGADAHEAATFAGFFIIWPTVATVAIAGAVGAGHRGYGGHGADCHN